MKPSTGKFEPERTGHFLPVSRGLGGVAGRAEESLIGWGGCHAGGASIFSHTLGVLSICQRRAGASPHGLWLKSGRGSRGPAGVARSEVAKAVVTDSRSAQRAELDGAPAVENRRVSRSRHARSAPSIPQENPWTPPHPQCALASPLPAAVRCVPLRVSGGRRAGSRSVYGAKRPGELHEAMRAPHRAKLLAHRFRVPEGCGGTTSTN